MSVHIVAKQNRTCVFTITLKDADDNNITIDSGDVIRVKIGRLGQTPAIDLDSAAASSNGSTVASANPCQVRVDQDDLDIDVGVYNIESGIVDDSDSDAFKHADEGVFVVRDAQLGDVALT